MLQVNLFPLRVDLEGLRIFCFRPLEPKKLLADLRDRGWYAFQKGEEVWAYGLEAPGIPAPLVGVERPRGTRGRIQALNSYLNQRLQARGFVRLGRGQGWLDLETYMAAEGEVAEGPFKGHALVVVSHPFFHVEVVRLEEGFFALVDMEHRVLTREGLGRLPRGLLEYFQSLTPHQVLYALDLEARKQFPLREAPAEARLFLHTAHQKALEAPSTRGLGTRRISLDTFAENQFRFEELLKHVKAFADFLDPIPLALPLPLKGVRVGGLRMARGLGQEAKGVDRLGFLEPRKVRVLLAFPDEKVVKAGPKPAGQTGHHIRKRMRGEGEWRLSRSTFVEQASWELTTRQLLLYHFVEQERLQSARNERAVLEAMGDVPSLLATWKRWGLELELVRPPVRYAPTGEVLEGEPKREGVDIAVVLAPESVNEAALGVLKRAFAGLRVKVVNPDTLMDRVKASSFAYDLAVQAGALPFRVEGFSRHVLGLRQGGDGFFWRLLEPGGQPLAQGQGFPEKEAELPPGTLIHYFGKGKGLEQVLAWTGRPVVWIQESHLRFSTRELPLGCYFCPLPEVAYLHTHRGNPGWPRALRVELVQGDVPLEEVLAQVYWLTKAAGGLYHPGRFPVSVVERTSWPKGRKRGAKA